MAGEKINYPYIPGGRRIKYVPASHPFMEIAKEYARRHSLDKTMPTGSVVARKKRVIGISGNGSDYHKYNICERVRQNVLTGEGYELCDGCHPKNHSEPRAIKNALEQGERVKGADLYLWGHWWCCKPCWDAIREAGIKNVYLMGESERLFNKNHPDNIVGRQFEL